MAALLAMRVAEKAYDGGGSQRDEHAEFSQPKEASVRRLREHYEQTTDPRVAQFALRISR